MKSLNPGKLLIHIKQVIRYNDMISIMTTYGAVFKWMRFLPLVRMTDSF
jgi:hypothetical protein